MYLHQICSIENFKKLAQVGFPHGRLNGLTESSFVLICEGIYKNQEVRELRNCVNGFLIGSSIMGERNLELAVRKIIYGFNKVCGKILALKEI